MGRLSDKEFLAALEPRLVRIRRLFRIKRIPPERAGLLTEEWAERLGLRPGIAVSVGAFDAHMGAVEPASRKDPGKDHRHLHAMWP